MITKAEFEEAKASGDIKRITDYADQSDKQFRELGEKHIKVMEKLIRFTEKYSELSKFIEEEVQDEIKESTKEPWTDIAYCFEGTSKQCEAFFMLCNDKLGISCYINSDRARKEPFTTVTYDVITNKVNEEKYDKLRKLSHYVVQQYPSK